jgi:3-hydroxybutyryl-CoA dehydrogenase
VTNSRAQVGVVGSGTMGVGIAVVSLLAGLRTVLTDVSDELVARGVGQVERFIDRGVSVGKFSPANRDDAMARLVPTTDLAGLAGATLVVEAISEDLDAKRVLLSRLDEVCDPTTIVATNTSTLSITRIAAGSARPEQVVGMHFCNPAPLMKLVEVSAGLRTSEATLQRAVAAVHNLGKVPVTVEDTPGFLVNRLLIPFENDCLRLLESKQATVETIDEAVTLGLGYPMGTFRLLDVVGLDVHRDVAMSLYDQLHDPRFVPPPIVDRMIAAGWLGRKTGKGFYDYPNTHVFGA